MATCQANFGKSTQLLKTDVEEKKRNQSAPQGRKIFGQQQNIFENFKILAKSSQKRPDFGWPPPKIFLRPD